MPQTGQCPALYNWETYTGVRNRILVNYAGDAQLRDNINSAGDWKTGIDRFSDTTRHETRHVTQVIEHNGLNPHNVSTPAGAKVGWSWANAGAPILRNAANIQAARYNHFQTGPDGQPGNAGADDDGDVTVDELDEFIAGPTNTVVGDDIDLDPEGDFWGAVGTEPDPNQGADGDGATASWNNFGWIDNNVSGANGSQANRAENTNQDQFRLHDWADPGKQHGPDLAVPNPDGEINAYTD